MELKTITKNLSNGVLEIALNRPEVMNAINEEMGNELYHALKQADLDTGVRAIVLTGTGRGFCSGQDLGSDIGSLEHLSLTDIVRDRYNALIAKMISLRVPLIAAVNGMAAGAGLGLALACDLRLASADAQFTVAFNKIGLVPDSGVSYFLPRLIGLGKAVELTWTSDKISAEEAKQMGIVNQVYATDDFRNSVHQFAEYLASGPVNAFAMTKQLMTKNLESSVPQALENEAKFQGQAGQSDEFREGVAAFREKRRAEFWKS
ncbi:enoyl-CoA hydratase/isomerase family protein [Alicyclobacillus sp. SO9]|uniref:enoyl-CoA hydratase/isomerase family protein n=1 Tax=Alicyclobacillus sp. SO9 TaxID=2665646 RepID=UPI0018E79C26|nr:enoyl-CoA hydratase-related protein [Alicyclobacillus sp. SO9]QQE77556.1 enoyl-CoA hydratase/isomerase family protein [Alicyclobacillus sp. SO9]